MYFITIIDATLEVGHGFDDIPWPTVLLAFPKFIFYIRGHKTYILNFNFIIFVFNLFIIWILNLETSIITA